MRIQQSPNVWSCLPTACATVLGIPVQDFIRHTGQDGGQIVWPGLLEPSRRRGFHIQECIDVLLRAGYAVTPFEVFPRIAPAFSVPALTILYQGSESAAFRRFRDFIRSGVGIITGHSNTSGHAVAYDHGEIFDCKRARPYPYHHKTCEENGFIGYCAWQFNNIGTP